MKIFVGSLQYSPIFKSHCFAFGKECEKLNHEVKYILSSRYDWMLNEDERKKSFFIGKSSTIVSNIIDGLDLCNKCGIRKLIECERPDFVYMHNIQPFLNNYIATATRIAGGKFIQHIHEPYVENKRIYGGFQRYWLSLFELNQEILLRSTNIAVLSSARAFKLFEKRYQGFRGRTALIPLMYEDLGLMESLNESRNYVTFIGPPVPAKGPEIFLDVVELADTNNINLQFLLISRSKIDNGKRYRKYKNLRILGVYEGGGL